MTTGLYSQHLNDRKKLYIRNTVLALMLILFALIAIFPIFYMIMSSFGPAVATAGTSRSVIPRRFTLDSYKAFFSFNKYSVRWIWNSFVVASLTVIGNVIFASLAGYAFSKINFKGRRWLFGMILVAMMIPYQVTQVPLYILIANKLKMTNTYAALILPGVVTSYNIFLAKQFFTSIPTPLIESAKLDGCSQLRIFVKIIMPLSKTVLAVMAINTFLSTWNSFFWPFLVTSKDYMYTIQVGLKTFKFANETLLAPMMAGATLSALPMFILFFLVASLITTIAVAAGADAAVFAPLKTLSKFFIVMAMAAIGLNTDLVKLVKSGAKPLLMGLICWICIAAASLAMQHMLGLW